MELSQGMNILERAARSQGLDSRDLEVIRNGSHLVCKLPGGVVARVGQHGTQKSAYREVAASHWLGDHGLPTVKAVNTLLQPTVVDGHPVTWWEFLPSHRPATPAELGSVLHILHNLPRPAGLDIPKLDPFVKISQQIGATKALSQSDQDWISKKLDELQRNYAHIEWRSPYKLIHGDAWQGNVAVSTEGQAILLDLESVSLGPPEWDLVPIAADYVDFARITPTDYGEFVTSYGGFDVTSWTNFRTLADIQELKWISFAFTQAESREGPAAEKEARHRLACFRDNLPKPWKWNAL
ncbi:aminoglycoside phosphotransferase family protein [Umezawaea sp. Da 62-37]|uniref:phosphotransferase family protein n=1 Tax=Umezawaea sp. Da 62-37 TaxID=3075927 RepID=UPI0028F6C332|nr:aminoglycoside phosphotransferase family protein [Umezawaea sp. Da 62-37]WNV89693.1 aminoglycoside phosphotransferase family protein [Umezawaea sp. Da 62-37]